MYFFNGGGVAVGDLNNDGLPDLYLGGNQVSSRLYLNQGQLTFKDITHSSGTASSGWTSGVTMVDINADGWLDIYVCQTGYADASKRKNLLFINQRDNTFKEQAATYGLDINSYSTQSAFLDFDLDGDLDLYLLNHDHLFYGANAPLPKKTDGSAKNTDQLFEHVIRSDGSHYFVDVSSQAGISSEGFGLGVAISDIDLDGWPDIYVANDFISNDLLLINQRDGTYSNEIGTLLDHQSHNSMGCDIADLNNDGWSEILVVDMLPATNERVKMMAMNTNEDIFALSQKLGYQPQYTRNTLQWNRGFIPGHNTNDLFFSEIGQLAGIHRTDWSWTGWCADLNLDGWKDILITNGYFKDVTNKDFIAYRRRRTTFTTQDSQDSLYFELLTQMHPVKLKNYLFKNQRNLTFKDVSAQWINFDESLSNGAVIGDLDGDGDPDILINRINEKAALYENLSTGSDGDHSHYLQVSLKGPAPNPNAIGARIKIYHDGQVQLHENYSTRGYYSSAVLPSQFGLGKTPWIDSVEIIWPDGKTSWAERLKADQLITFHHSKAGRASDPKNMMDSSLMGDRRAWPIHHQDNEFPAFKINSLLHYSQANLGPNLAVGDVDQNGYDDIFLGGGAQKPAYWVLQHDGQIDYVKWQVDSMYEDLGSLLFDADGDNDLDLYVVSGGSNYTAGSVFYQDRLYLNDGTGNFGRDTSALPEISSSGSCVIPADIDGDGDQDLFVGGRQLPGHYPQPPQSYLLENREGQFVNVTLDWNEELNEIGMVTDAIWTDFNDDKLPDLMIVGEWMPITFFINRKNHFEKEIPNIAGLPHTGGWWNCISAGDLNLDGKTDYVLGNVGLNTGFRSSATQPVRLYYDDFDGDGSMEPLITHFEESNEGNWVEVPFLDRDHLLSRMPSLRKKFPTYTQFAEMDIQGILNHSAVEKLSAPTLASGCLLKKEGFSYQWSTLPLEAQISAIYDMYLLDLNHDQILDLLAVGNTEHYIVEIGRQDALKGFVGINDGNGTFKSMSAAKSGFFAPGNLRSIDTTSVAGQLVLLVAGNNEPLMTWSLPE